MTAIGRSATAPADPPTPTPSAPTPSAPTPGAPASALGHTIYLLLDLPVSLTLFTVTITMVSLGFGLAITLVGLPLLAATVAGSRLVGVVERARVAALLGHPLDAPPPFAAIEHPAPERDGGGGLAGFTTLVSRSLTDGPGWRAIAYSLLLLPWGVTAFSLCLLIWTLALAALPFAAIVALISVTAGRPGRPHRAAPRLARIVAAQLAALTSVDLALVTRLLGPGRVAQLEHRVETLTESRDASLSGAAEELARLERDLHDGTQQRLVGLAMELGLARERLAAGEPAERVLPLVDAAHSASKTAITELRDLVRGVQPAILVDRGLDAALSGLAARSPVPTRLTVDLPPPRPAPAVEAAAYYIVAEALTNAAKHAGATRVTVEVRRSIDDLAVTVVDDGRGGAAAGPTGGLSGMRDRARSVEGHLAVDSPPGGPTVITALLPCRL